MKLSLEDRLHQVVVHARLTSLVFEFCFRVRSHAADKWLLHSVCQAKFANHARALCPIYIWHRVVHNDERIASYALHVSLFELLEASTPVVRSVAKSVELMEQSLHCDDVEVAVVDH